MANVDITDAVVNQVRNVADIVEVVNQATPLKAKGRTHLGLCPFHREKTPSLNVDRDKGLFYCFGCGEGGDVFKFLMLADRFTFPEAVEHLATRFGIDVPRRANRKADRGREQLLELIEDAAESYYQAIRFDGNPAAIYLRKRGIPEEIWNQYGFGYAPDSWDYILTRLGRKYSKAQIIEAGLARLNDKETSQYDRFRDRLMIPIHNEGGMVVGFGGRSLDDQEPKYLNSPESTLFDKSRLLYNYHRARDGMRKLDRAVLVEGYFDCIALDHAGVSGVVASMGTSLTVEQAKLIRRRARRVVICYDGDTAGRRATLKAAPVLLSSGLDVAVANVGHDEDPDSFLEKHGQQALMDLLGKASDIFDFALEETAGSDDLTTQEKREALEKLRELLAATSDPVLRNDAAHKIADRLRLDFQTVWSGLKQIRASSAAEPAPPRPAPITSGETWVLRGLLAEETDPQILDTIDADLFEDPACRQIAGVIIDLCKNGKRLDFQAVATHLKGEVELTRLSELAFEGQDSEANYATLATTLDRMRKRQLDRMAANVQAEIQDAVRSGDSGRVDELMKKKINLLKGK